jgi:hypothetical protein
VSPAVTPRSTSSRAFGAVIALDVVMAFGYFLVAGFSADARYGDEPMPWPTVVLLGGAIASIVCPIAALIADRIKVRDTTCEIVALVPLVVPPALLLIGGLIFRG